MTLRRGWCGGVFLLVVEMVGNLHAVGDLVNVGEYQELVYNSLQKTTEQRVSQLCCETSK